MALMQVFRTYVVPTLKTVAALLALSAGLFFVQTAFGQSPASDRPFVPARVASRVDDADLVILPGNTHPLAQAKYDQGLVDPNKLLQKIVLVLKRSPEQEKALAAFNERQYDPKSPDFHHWLDADAFGQLYGPADADMAAVTSWLQNNGFRIDLVTRGRVSIQFTGTVAQIQNAFHVEMHRYLVNGEQHISNDRDPSIPAALAPVVTGIASLNDFFPKHYSHPGNYVKRDLKTGKYSLWDTADQARSRAASGGFEPNRKGPQASGPKPEFGYTDPETGYQREELSPYDVATIYNILPLWNESTPINGKGIKVAIVALSDVETSDFNTFRSSFGLPAGTLTTLHSGIDPGITGSQDENTEDTEMVSATAPGAEVVLVADVNTSTTSGLVSSITYIVENKVAPILTMSYGTCEMTLGSSGNSLWNSTFQQAATAGISAFVASGDSGSAQCTSQDGTPPYGDTYGLAVSGMASTPYATAVGGTDVQWYLTEGTTPISTYWNSSNDANGASAKGYMPEMSWNDTCTNPLLLNVYTAYSSNEALCNAAINSDPGLVEMASGSGGISTQYTKPSWQTGVSGIPTANKRYLPDVSMYAAYGFQDSTGIPGSALLVCESSNSPTDSCDYSNPDYIIYEENGGTSAASPLTAGIMALVLQKIGGAAQGLANPVFYQLAAKETYANCNSNTVKAGNSCIFYDTTSGSNAMNCYTGDPDCVTNTSGDQAGILSGYSAGVGYDLTTGLGTMNVANLVNAWPTTATAPAITLSPTSLTFASTTVGSTTAAQTVTVKNTGTASATLTSETITGSDETSFVKSATTCTSTLAAGASCTVSVEFKPQTTGALTAALAVADNASGTPQEVKLSGTGVAAAPAITLSPTSLTFASTTVGSTTAAQTVTVKNTGTASATLTSETITGTDASSFVKSATTCTSTLAAGASCTVSVEFKPATTGALTAALSIADNASGSPQTAALSGTGTAAASGLSISPTSLTFTSTPEGNTSEAQAVTLKNVSSSTVTLKSITLGGSDATSFEDLSACGTSLAANGSCMVLVSFKPATTGSLKGTLSISSSASSTAQTVALAGTATAEPALKLSATSIAFAKTAPGSTSEATVVTLTNSGSTTAAIDDIVLGGADPADFEELNTCGATLAASSSCSIYVSFKPAAADSYTGSVLIYDNAASSPQTIALSGTGS